MPHAPAADETQTDAAVGSQLHDHIRILAVGNMYPPQHAGGYELAWQVTMQRARALGHRVRVLTTGYRRTTEPEHEPDVHRTLEWYWDPGRYAFPRLSVAERLGLEHRNAAELAGHLAAFRPDVVAWWSMGCMSLAMIEQVRRAGIPAVFLVHDDWLVYGWRHDAWMRLWRGRRAALAPIAERVCGVPTRVPVQRAGSFVFNSQYTLDRAREAGHAAPGARVVHPGIDDSLLEALPVQPWRWRVAYVGRIDRQKGVDTAVSALAHLPASARLTIWGTGDDEYAVQLRCLSDRLGVSDRLRFGGFVGGADLRRAYTEADAIVFPVRWNEPFGLVPIEAMALGRPVVSTAGGGAVEYLRDGDNALIVAADDPAALAGALERLAGSERLRARLRTGGRRTAAGHTASRFAARTLTEIVRAVR
jgi:glycosyltransferase involved in cell wall biosynthesis